jgi:hypothetical protein
MVNGLSVKVENNKMLIEFSLTQPKRAWKIRSKVRRNRRGTFVPEISHYVFTPRIGDALYEGDIFEWMIANEEVRDILSALRCISREEYDNIRSRVYNLMEANFIDWSHEQVVIKKLDYGICIEATYRGKQKKTEELTPYLLVLFPLDPTSEVHYLVDKRGRRIKETVGYKVKAGDKLLWIMDVSWIEDIARMLASLDEDHNIRVKENIFDVIERLGDPRKS